MDSVSSSSGSNAFAEREGYRHSAERKKTLLSRLNRIEGQVRGVKKMIESDVYCDDVIIQVSAIQSALNGFAQALLDDHVKHCLALRLQGGDEEALDELLETVGRLMRK